MVWYWWRCVRLLKVLLMCFGGLMFIFWFRNILLKLKDVIFVVWLLVMRLWWWLSGVWKLVIFVLIFIVVGWLVLWWLCFVNGILLLKLYRCWGWMWWVLIFYVLCVGCWWWRWMFCWDWKVLKRLWVWILWGEWFSG